MKDETNKAVIENMKCCGNCTFSVLVYTFFCTRNEDVGIYPSGYCEHWKTDLLNREDRILK